jgi:DMATS type aromatic prenyltransferase
MKTYNQVAIVQLEALCNAIGFDKHTTAFAAIQKFLFEGWGDKEIPAQPFYPSAIGDDHSPFEFSIAFSRKSAELRLLFETQADRPSLLDNQHAALAFNRRLAKQYKINLERFDRVKDLFLVPDPKPPFSFWHAACFEPGEEPDFKLYLNPQVQGPDRAHELICEALGRLGFGKAAISMIEDAAWRGRDLDELNYFSLDLSNAPNARVKVYFRHSNATARELERTFKLAPTHRPGDLVDYCQAMVRSEGPFTKKPVSSCFSFVEGSDVPSAVTFHFPIAHYLPDDATIAERITSYLLSQNMAATSYARALTAFANRSFGADVGIQSYASYRREKSGMRLTAYLSPELFSLKDKHESHTRLKAEARRITPAPVKKSG